VLGLPHKRMPCKRPYRYTRYSHLPPLPINAFNDRPR